MKKIVLLALVTLMFTNAFSQKFSATWTYPVKVESRVLSGPLIDGYNSTKTKVDGAVSGSLSYVRKADSANATAGSYTPRYDFYYEPSNMELWKIWHAGGSDVSPFMPSYPLVNVGATALVDGRLYLYRWCTPVQTTVHGFRFVQTASFSGTADGQNTISIYSYSNDSVYKIGGCPSSSTFWVNTINTSVDKALTTPITLNPGCYAAAPIYNSSAQTTAPAMEATYSSSIAKSVTLTGGWRTTSYINSVATPAASYKYTGNVAGESTVPHIFLAY